MLELLPLLAGLAGLQRCHLRGIPVLLWHGLPTGPWQRSLRWLSAEWPVLAASLPWLGKAMQLQALHLNSGIDSCCGVPLGVGDLESPEWAAFRSWALGQALHLQRLTFDGKPNELAEGTMDEEVEAAAAYEVLLGLAAPCLPAVT